MDLQNGNTVAYVRDGALIAEFGSATRPFVWRYDLTKVHAMGLRVAETAGVWNFGVEGPKGEFSPVAAFADKDEADRALQQIVQALRRQGSEKQALALLAYAGTLLIGLLILVSAAGVARQLMPENGLISKMAAATTGESMPKGKSVPASQMLQAPTP